MSEVNTTYAGVQIDYNERENRWEFVLRGRNKWTTTLKLAKEAIDKPDTKKKKHSSQSMRIFSFTAIFPRPSKSHL